MTTSAKADIAVLRTEIRSLHEDVTELKDTTKKLEKFMYHIEGGKAWMFALLTIAGALGAMISQSFKVFSSHG